MTRAMTASALLLVVVLSGCATSSGGTAATVVPPPAGAGFDYQLGGASSVPEGVTVVARDSTESPAGAGYDICYVNAFQSQPADAELWRTERAQLLLRDAAGRPLVDPAWPDEYVLDTTTPLLRSGIVAMLGPRITACAEAGYQAVEFDNLDTYTRFPDRLTIEDNIALARSLADLAHSLGLAVGQKNAAADSVRLRDEVGFDFAIAEDCAQFSECAAYVEAYGDLVFDIEYDASFLTAACEAVGSAIVRDRGLVAADAEGYAFQSCAA